MDPAPRLRELSLARRQRGIEAEGNMARILLAEDDAATRDLVQRALGLEGHEVIVTQDGVGGAGEAAGDAYALRCVRHRRADAGPRRRRSGGEGPNDQSKLRIVLMSGFADELDRAAHLKAKISRVITKPFTLEQIRSAVKAALG